MTLDWQSFLKRYGPLARNMARGLGCREEDADDLIQEACASLWRVLEETPSRIEGESHMRNYFLKAVRNLSLRIRRRPTPANMDDLAAPSPPTHDEPPPWESMAQAIQRLSAKEQDLLRRRYSRSQTFAEIERELGIPVSTLHSRQERILSKLRRALNRCQEADP